MLQYYDITVKATGAQFPVSTPGRFLYYLAGSAGGADNTLKVRAGFSGSTVLLRPGQSVRLDPADKDVDAWYLTNYAGAADIIGVVLIGEGEFDDNRISGSVEVIDGGKARTLAGSAFLASVYMAATAAAYSHVQLWNPVGSGKNLIVEAVKVGTDTAATTTGLVRFYNTPLATLVGNPPAKMAGKAASTSELRTQTNAAVLTAANPDLMQCLISSAVFYEKKLAEPIIVPPGYGLTVHDNVVNNSISLALEYFEESAM